MKIMSKWISLLQKSKSEVGVQKSANINFSPDTHIEYRKRFAFLTKIKVLLNIYIFYYNTRFFK